MKKEFKSISDHDSNSLCNRIGELVNYPPYWELINITSVALDAMLGGSIVYHYAFFQREIKD